MANSKKGAKQPKPIQIPRPGKIAIDAPKTMNSTEAMKRVWNMGGQVYKEEVTSGG